jgi:hypothetical protein
MKRLNEIAFQKLSGQAVVVSPPRNDGLVQRIHLRLKSVVALLEL